ncbi:glycerol dehydrogenase [Cordyceps militaris]|uniref:Glycerol dehydrogenase n=1 Tax=Cordyceps militaris TaxID=73501 RepID=A0A2H4SL72_CORMI|nr:glycerol dehydrogenase [Cordyceps militaris]
MATPTHFKLNTGASIPAIGLGTWQAPEGEVGRAVKHALQDGYRHLDCALIYQNEKEIGKAIKESGVPREDIFITSKLWNTYHSNVSESLEQTLRDLQTDYLDLYLIHWPIRLVPTAEEPLLPKNPDGTRAVDSSWDQRDTWKQMEALYRSGKVKAIGVSNFSVPYLEHLAAVWTVVPAVNQVELHPYNPQHKLKEWCNSRGILLEAYCPLGSTGAPLFSDETVSALAAKHGVSPATILISYHVNKGSVVLPKSITPSRIRDNLKAIPLPEEDVALLDALAANGKQKRVNTPLWGHDLGFEDWYGPKK